MDWTATLLAATHSQSLPHLDGVDVRAFLEGASPQPERSLFWHMPHLWGPKGPGLEPFSALREGDCKLIWFHDSPADAPRLELYDLADDLGETHDLASQRPLEVARLAERMRTMASAVGAQSSRRKPDGESVDWPSLPR
jgi:arylsulfatase A-like enzyme